MARPDRDARLAALEARIAAATTPHAGGSRAVRWLVAELRGQHPEACGAIVYAALHGEPVRDAVIALLFLAPPEARRQFFDIAAGRCEAPEVRRAQ